MNVCRYQISGRIHIDAPVEQAYARASDPELVPSYAPEIARIEIVERFTEQRVLVKSYLKLAGFTWGSLYQFHYRHPTHYSGVQESGGLLRGYFSFRFQPHDGGTTAVHTEGILSPIPFVAWIVGFIYFHILSSGGISAELERLKKLAEGVSV
jgi:hypothetical protein